VASRDLVVGSCLLAVVIATHAWEYVGFEQHRDAQRYFYAMQGWSGVGMALALLWFCRELSPGARAVVYLTAVWQGVQESLVGVCGTALLLSGRPYQERGNLCQYVVGWDWWVIGLTFVLWWLAWKNTN
jgi:hypothetical protein